MLKQWNVDGVMQKQLNKDTITVIVKIWVWGGGGGVIEPRTSLLETSKGAK